MSQYFDFLPNELLSIILSNVYMEDIINLKSVTPNPEKLVTVIKCKNGYNIDNAIRLKFEDLNKNIEYIDSGVLICIDNIKDFDKLKNYQNLKHANFLLPYNKYESFKIFLDYFEAFMDNNKFNLSKCVFRLLYQSDTNQILGAIIYKRFIKLIANKFSGFNPDEEFIDNTTECGGDRIGHLDLFVKMIKRVILKRERNMDIFYNLNYVHYNIYHEDTHTDIDVYQVYVDPLDFEEITSENLRFAYMNTIADKNHDVKFNDEFLYVEIIYGGRNTYETDGKRRDMSKLLLDIYKSENIEVIKEEKKRTFDDLYLFRMMDENFNLLSEKGKITVTNIKNTYLHHIEMMYKTDPLLKVDIIKLRENEMFYFYDTVYESKNYLYFIPGREREMHYI